MASSGLYSSLYPIAFGPDVALTLESLVSFKLANILVRLGGIDMLANMFVDEEGLFRCCG